MGNAVVGIEKRRANKAGLVILVLVLIAGLSFGGYYLYKHPDIIKSVKEKIKEITKSSEDDKPVDSSNKLKEVNMKNVSISNDFYGGIDDIFKMYIKDVEITNEGYKFNVGAKYDKDYEGYEYLFDAEYEQRKVNISCFEVLIDGYQTGATFNISVEYFDDEITTSFVIKKTLLNELKFNDFTNLTFYFDIESYSMDGVLEKFSSCQKAEVIRIQKLDNSKKLSTMIGMKNGVNLYYYEKLEDKDNYYLYFVVDNTNELYYHNIKLNKLIIDNVVYNYNDLDVRVIFQGKKLFYIPVPKKSFEEINEIKVSMFIIADRENIRNADLEDIEDANLFDEAIYITNLSILKNV